MSWNAEWYSYRGVSRSENRSGSWWAEIWARESMFMSRDEPARAGTSQARMETFETNNAMPTLRQLGLLGITR